MTGRFPSQAMPCSNVGRKYMRVRAFSIVSLFMFLFAAAILPAAAQTMLATVPGQDKTPSIWPPTP